MIGEVPCRGDGTPADVVARPDLPVVDGAVVGVAGVGIGGDVAERAIKFSGGDVPCRAAVDMEEVLGGA